MTTNMVIPIINIAIYILFPIFPLLQWVSKTYYTIGYNLQLTPFTLDVLKIAIYFFLTLVHLQCEIVSYPCWHSSVLYHCMSRNKYCCLAWIFWVLFSRDLEGRPLNVHPLLSHMVPKCQGLVASRDPKVVLL